MKTVPRLFLLLLFCLALPVNGLAGALAAVLPCSQAQPVQKDTSSAMPMVMADEDDATAHPCCTSVAADPDSGTPCKQAGDCHKPASLLLVMVAASLPAPAPARPLAGQSPAGPRSSLQSFWRPPRA